MSDLPRRAVTRTAKLATLPLGFAGRTAIGLGKRVGGKSAELVAAELQARTAEQLFKVLGELKGGAMKFGQALSIFEAALPEELAGPYRATLTKLQDAAPPMPAATVHKVLAAELGPQWRRKFKEFNDVPAAAASIGQVHRGVWKDGRQVAVKVQYPGAGDALISDFTQVARFGRMAAGWIPGLDVKPILEELKARVVEELDYTLEASSQSQFAAAFADDPVFAVPQVVTSTQKLIVSEWLDGLPLSRLIADGTQAERDLGARRYLEFLSAIDDPGNGLDKLNKITRTVHREARAYRGFNFFDQQDEALFLALARGEFTIGGVQNKALRACCPQYTSGQMSRTLRRLRTHGLIKKATHSYKYYLTVLGKHVVALGLKLKQLVILPELAAAPCR